MKNIQKTVSIIAIAAIFALAVVPFVAGAQNIFGNPSNLPGQFENSTTTASGLIGKILGIVLGIVGLIAVLFLVWGGFQYITSAGDEEKVEKAKGTMINALIGVVVVLLAYALVRIVANAVGGSV